jgi:hypothetical protein
MPTHVSAAAARSVKKRNRHLATACAPRSVAPVRAVELLSQQYFFTSPKLAALATEAEILQKVPTPECPLCRPGQHVLPASTGSG